MKPLIAFNLWQWVEAYRQAFEPPECGATHLPPMRLRAAGEASGPTTLIVCRLMTMARAMPRAVAVHVPPEPIAVSMVERPGLTGSQSAIVRRADMVSPVGLGALHVRSSPPHRQTILYYGDLMVNRGDVTGNHHRPCSTAGHESFAIRRRGTPSASRSVWSIEAETR